MEENNSPFSDFFKALRGFIRGKISRYDLENSDDFIYEVIFHGSNPASAEIVIDFDYENECLEFLGFDEDDSHFIRNVNSGHYDFFDSHQLKEDFKEGYGIFENLNDENLDLLKKIVLQSSGTKISSNPDWTERSKIGQYLYNAFPDESEEFIENYSILRDEETADGAQKYIDEELTKYLEKLNMKFVVKYERISIKIGAIYKLISNIGDTSLFSLDLKEFLEEIFKSSDDLRPGRFWEDVYEYQGEGDYDGFNIRINRLFEKMLEIIEESNEETFEIIKKVSDDFEFHRYHDLPKDKNFKFEILEVEKESNKIVMKIVDRRSWNAKKVKISYQNFNNFLYHPELFDLSSIFE